MDESNKSASKVPYWLNILLVIFIFATLMFGAATFLRESGNPRYEVFIPAGIFFLFWFLIQFASILFSDADLATVMMVILLMIGLIVLAIAIRSKEESDKSTFIHIAAALLGLALGIPFGERLRKGRANMTARRSRRKRGGVKKVEEEKG